MSLGTALFLLLVALALVFLVYSSWRSIFLQFTGSSKTASASALSSPEWQALLDRRSEIERDPSLDDASRALLIQEWRNQAELSRPHMESQSDHAMLPWPRSAPALLALAAFVLAAAVLFAHAVGAFHSRAFVLPSFSPGQHVNAPSLDAAEPDVASHPGDGVSLAERLASLKTRLAEQPDDLQGWVLLARTHAAQQQYTESAQALQKALALAPQHPDLLADLADMLAMANGRQLAGEPMRYVELALNGDPNHEKALALAASAAEQRGDTSAANALWARLSQVQQQQLVPPVGATQSPGPVQTPVAFITVQLPEPLPRTGGSEAAEPALFVMLKDQPGPGMPMAAVRITQAEVQRDARNGKLAVPIVEQHFLQGQSRSDLPATLHAQARWSITGTAQASPGDWVSTWATVSIGKADSPVHLQLSKP
ncbi:MAG TPA: hypothetical protein VFV39_09205 [Limnobacter sp.]|nr:hypothetical protein [Limnobacter sp.]